MESATRNNPLTIYVTVIGRSTIGIVNSLGASTIFLIKSFLMIFQPKQVQEIIHQVYYIGTKSTNIVLMVGFFTGMVLGIQLYYELVKFRF